MIKKLLVGMLFMFLISCSNSGEDGKSSFVLFDISGPWSFENVTFTFITINTNSLLSFSEENNFEDEIRQIFEEEYKNVVININQDGDKFTMFVPSTGETYSGDVKGSEYTYTAHENRTVTIDDREIILDLDCKGVLNMISDNKGNGVVDYDLYITVVNEGNYRSKMSVRFDIEQSNQI